MCLPLIAVGVGLTVAELTAATAAVATVAGTAVSVASAAAQQSAQKKAASTAAFTNNEAVLKQEALQFADQEATMRYQDTTWQQDIDFATQTLGYQKQEFAKQADYVMAAGNAIDKNQTAAYGQTALQAVQKNIAITLGEANTATAGAQARATAQVAADGRGVEGHSVNSIVDDVMRQYGQSIQVMEMNRSAINYQARVDMEAAKAAGDTQLGQLQASIKTYSPSTPIRAPGPVSGVQDATLTQTAQRSDLGDSLAIAGAGISGGIGAFKTTADLTGTSVKDLAGGVGSLLGIT